MIYMIFAVVCLLVPSCVIHDRPAQLKAWHLGNPENVVSSPGGGLVLIGGGRDPDEAFAWFNRQANHGDIVVLRASRSDGYNHYLYHDIGLIDSVQTLLVDSRELAADPWVIEQINQAEGIFIAGGDQADYVDFWANTPLSTAVTEAYQRGSVLGGTSAGAMILGGIIFEASEGSVTSEQSMRNPYYERVQLQTSIFSVPLLKNVIIDTHFEERERMGRLLVFMARALQDQLCEEIQAFGIDESTAVIVTASGQARVLGSGSATVMYSKERAEVCAMEQSLIFDRIAAWKLSKHGGTFPFRIGMDIDGDILVSVQDGYITMTKQK